MKFGEYDKKYIKPWIREYPSLLPMACSMVAGVERSPRESRPERWKHPSSVSYTVVRSSWEEKEIHPVLAAACFGMSRITNVRQQIQLALTLAHTSALGKEETQTILAALNEADQKMLIFIACGWGIGEARTRAMLPAHGEVTVRKLEEHGLPIPTNAFKRRMFLALMAGRSGIVKPSMEILLPPTVRNPGIVGTGDMLGDDDNDANEPINGDPSPQEIRRQCEAMRGEKNRRFRDDK